MTTLSSLIPNPTEVELRFEKLTVNNGTATYYYYDALKPMKNDNGESIVLSATTDSTGNIVPQYLYEYVPISLSIYESDGTTEKDIEVLEAEAALSAIDVFQKKYTNEAMEAYVVPDEIIMSGNLYVL